jgi:hypothetical protein
MHRVLPVHKNTTLLTMRKNILAFPRWEKTSIGVGQLSISHYRMEQERERKMCRWVIIESGLRLRRTRNGYVKKNEQVDWASSV